MQGSQSVKLGTELVNRKAFFHYLWSVYIFSTIQNSLLCSDIRNVHCFILLDVFFSTIYVTQNSITVKVLTLSCLEG